MAYRPQATTAAPTASIAAVTGTSTSGAQKCARILREIGCVGSTITAVRRWRRRDADPAGELDACEAPGMHPWLECGKFLRICRNNFRTTGAILPSSRFLARALVKHLESPRPAARILEVGPGSGSEIGRASCR